MKRPIANVCSCVFFRAISGASARAILSASYPFRIYLISLICIGATLFGAAVSFADSDHDKISLLHLKRERLHADELELVTDIAEAEKIPNDKENGAKRKAKLEHLYSELRSTRLAIQEIEEELSM